MRRLLNPVAMKKLIFSFLFLFSFLITHAQISALTETGRQVILFNDGTWKYSTENKENNKNKPDTIKTNPAKFSKSPAATFLVKSEKTNTGIFIDPDKWTFKPHLENETSPEYRFNFKSDDCFALLITEKTPFNLEIFPEIALKNAQKAAIDARITNQEYRLVNGNKVLFLEMSATIQGIKFKYVGYYFSNEKGSIQLLTYTSEATYKDTFSELETFLNGFVVIN